MKKILAAVLALCLCMSVFAACTDAGTSSAANSEASSSQPASSAADSSSEDASSEPETGDTTASGEFTYWTFTDSANNLVTEFNKVYPDVTVNLQVYGGDEYKTKLMTTIQSGSDIPDLFDLEEGYVYEFFDSSALEDLSALGFEEKTSGFYDYIVASSKDSSGVIKGINFQTSPVGFWYLRDAAKQWLGTDDPDEISAMLTSWEDVKAAAEKVKTDSNGSVYLWPNTSEMVKVAAFSFQPLARDGKFEVTEDWYGLLDDMRDFYDSGVTAELGSWGEDWAAKWNNGELLFRAMPSWDFFTDWEKNTGNVGVAAPFENSYEGGTFVSMWSGSEKKELAQLFLEFICSDEFQTVNLESYNQIPASKTLTETLSADYSAENFGGQNLLMTYDKINSGIVDIVPDKYTRALQNMFQKHADEGIKAGSDNDTIIANLKAEVKDKYPELTGTD